MSLAINGHGDLETVTLNGIDLNFVYFNGVLVWPESSKYIYYKYEFLESIREFDVEENAYTLHLSTFNVDGTYKYVYLSGIPEWQFPQANVLGPDNKPYATPTAFVRKLVIDHPMTPITLQDWFSHLYAGLNNNAEVREAHPFIWEGFDNLVITKVDTLAGVFKTCKTPIIDISNWDISKFKDLSSMFYDSAVEHIYVSPRWSVDHVTKSDDMFYQSVYLHNWDSHWTDKTKAIIDQFGNKGYLERKV